MAPSFSPTHVFGSALCLHLVPWEQGTVYPSVDTLHYLTLLFSHLGFSACCYQTILFLSRKSITLASLKPFLSLPGQNWVFSPSSSDCNAHSSPLWTCAAIAFTRSCSHQAETSSQAGFPCSFLHAPFFSIICPITSIQWRWIRDCEMKLKLAKTLFWYTLKNFKGFIFWAIVKQYIDNSPSFSSSVYNAKKDFLLSFEMMWLLSDCGWYRGVLFPACGAGFCWIIGFHKVFERWRVRGDREEYIWNTYITFLGTKFLYV